VLSSDDTGHTNLVICARVRPDKESEFAHWHVRLQTAVLAAPGALSFEYRPPAPPDQEEAIALASFDTMESLRRWRHGDESRALIAQAVRLVEGGIVMQLAGQAAAGYIPQHSATELIITQIKPGKEDAYRAFAERIQKAQEAFPGYVGSFVQPPHQKEPGWTTLFRFAELLKESEDLTLGFAAQRIDTSFPGWVPTDPATGKQPGIWKTASLVLLTLFPVVVLELKFLTPHLRTLNPALGTFVGNAISVGLTTWPLMPLAVRGFHAWLFPENQPRWLVLTSPLVLLCCYVVEIALLWRLL